MFDIKLDFSTIIVRSYTNSIRIKDLAYIKFVKYKKYTTFGEKS